MNTVQAQTKARSPGARAFRTAVLRGLAVLAPPLMTVLIFIWVGSTVQHYVLEPLAGAAREGLVWVMADIREDFPTGAKGPFVTYEGRGYQRLDDGKYIPFDVYEAVRKAPSADSVPVTALAVYRRYVELHYLRSYYVIPFVLCIFVLLLYTLGKFMAANIGRMFWNLFEWIVTHLPVVRSVYSGVKQVSDMMFSEREIEYTRVVAVEYPRKGIWSLGFVTSESFLDLHVAANEPILAVFIPCSPMPLTGFTINCLRSECIDLNMTFDQACQFAISCGVVVPAHQIPHLHANGEAAPEGQSLPAPAGSKSTANL